MQQVDEDDLGRLQMLTTADLRRSIRIGEDLPEGLYSTNSPGETMRTSSWLPHGRAGGMGAPETAPTGAAGFSALIHLDVAALDVAAPGVAVVGAKEEFDGEEVPVKSPAGGPAHPGRPPGR